MQIKQIDLMSNTNETHIIREAINTSRIFKRANQRMSKYLSIVKFKSEIYLIKYNILQDINLIDIKINIEYSIKIKYISELRYKDHDLDFFNEKDETVDIISLYGENIFNIYVGLKRYMKKQYKEEL